MTSDLGAPYESGHRPPAPDPVRLIQRFLNTLDIDRGSDDLDSRGGLEAWLNEVGLVAKVPASPEDGLARATELREAIRDLLARRNHGTVTPRVADRFGRATVSLGFRTVASTAGDFQLLPTSTGLGKALGAIVAVLIRSDADGSLARLKVCANDQCQWVYWDASRNRSGRWCTMALCGNRLKGRAFRQRTVARLQPKPSTAAARNRKRG